MLKISRLSAIVATIALISAGISLPAKSTSNLVSQFQAQSPVSVYIPANQPVPAQGSTVTLSFDQNDFTGPNAASDYQSALQTATTATVTYVIADLGYRSWPDVSSIANPGDLGYLVLLDFGGGNDFNYAFTGYFSFSSAANSYDAVGVSGLYSFVDAGVTYVWAPATLDLTGGTALLSAWGFTSPTAFTMQTNQTLDCSKVDSGAVTSCNGLTSLSGTVLSFTSSVSTVVRPTEFIGVAGLNSQISGGLVQTSLVQLPGGGASSQNSSEVKYLGPTLDSVRSTLSVKEQGTLILHGEKLISVNSITIASISVDFDIDESGVIQIKLPSGLKPGVYDIVMTSSSGTTTFIDAVTVKAPAKLRSFSLRLKAGDSVTNLLAEASNISAMYQVENGKIHCLANGEDSFEAAKLAESVCANLKVQGKSQKLVSTKDTFQGDGYWVRVYIAG